MSEKNAITDINKISKIIMETLDEVSKSGNVLNITNFSQFLAKKKLIRELLKLAKKPDDITLGQIVRLFEGQSDLVECVSRPEKCSMSDDCQVRLAWQDATRVLYEKLDATTIADLIQTKNCDDL